MLKFNEPKETEKGRKMLRESMEGKPWMHKLWVEEIERFVIMRQEFMDQVKKGEARPYLIPDIHHSPSTPVEITDIDGDVQFFKDTQDFKNVPFLNDVFDPMMKYPGIYKIDDLKEFIPEKNFKFLKRLPQPHEIDMERISSWKPPSLDTQLLNMGLENKTKFVMSTSSVSSLMTHLLFLSSFFKEADYSMLASFNRASQMRFMSSYKSGSSCFLRKLHGSPDIYAVDSDQGLLEPKHKILMDMGHIIEKICIKDVEEFQGMYVKSHQDLEKYKTLDSDYHRFIKVDRDLLIRSQIDCQGVDAQGNNIVFEIKSRAASVLRYRVWEYYKFLDYELKEIYGDLNTFEREYYDLIRGAFLKYFLQMHIGQMDGAFIFYHNTLETLGFEYIKQDDIKKTLAGDSFKADIIFYSSAKLTTIVLDKVIQDNPLKDGEFIKLGFLSHESGVLTLMVEVIKDIAYEEYIKVKIPNEDPLREFRRFYEPRKHELVVKKYNFAIYPKLNGNKNNFFASEVEKGDQISLAYTFDYRGLVNFDEYMSFLLNTAKEKEILPTYDFYTSWNDSSKRLKL